jgi:uncharacterized membrane protein YidH (DUF202 family)
MASILITMLALIVSVMRSYPRLRAWVTGLSVVGITAGVGLEFLGFFYVPAEMKDPLQNVALGIIIISVAFASIAIASYSDIKFHNEDTLTVELERLREERNTIQERLSDAPKSADVIDTIQLNLNQLSEYYVINKSQARTSFGFSVFAIVSGLVTIIAGIWIFYLQEKPNLQLTAITSIAGVLAEFIGAAYFYLYRKSLEQLNFFFLQLVRMQDTMLSVRLCEEVVPEDNQMQLRATIILTLLQRSSQNITVPQVISPAVSSAS